MKLLFLVGLLSSVYSSENYAEDGFNVNERQIVGGGNFGGFIGLTTYPAGPVLVEGKFERGNLERFGSIGQGYEERSAQKGQSNYDDRSQRYDNHKQSDDRYEYLGYSGGNGLCLGEFGDKDEYGYGRQSYGERNGFKINQGQNNYSYYDEETKERCDKLFGYTGPTANDEEENLSRPCALEDWQCIRKYFAANSKCKPAYGPIPDPLYLKLNTFFFPVVNLTVALSNPVVRGLSTAKMREFYVNKKSGNLVFAIDVLKLNETIPRAYFRYRRTAKESIVLADYATVESTSAITFTAIIPKVPNLRLDLADIHAFAQDSFPPLFVGPGAYSSTDPDVVSAFSQFLLQTPLVGREALFFQAQLFTSIYIQENICDFGLKLISV